MAVLCARVHGRLVSEGKECLEGWRSFGVSPMIQHYGCKVDLYGRVGLVDEAGKVMRSMPMESTCLYGVLALVDLECTGRGR